MSATKAPTEYPTFVNTVYASQSVTLRDIEEGRDGRGMPLYRTIRFLPAKVGMREEGEHQVPIVHGFYTPQDEQELAALRHVCAMGYCSAREESAELRRARQVLQAEEAAQAARMGR